MLFSEPPSPLAAAGALLVVVTNAAVATAKMRDAEQVVRDSQRAELTSTIGYLSMVQSLNNGPHWQSANTMPSS
eukprot:scaffold2911_cov40-Tisochrysis_lutea.AAC.2